MSSAKRILIVDDDRVLITWMSEALRKRGYAVDTAASGVAGMAQIKEHKPDLIITDVVMPEMDGFQFYKEIRTNPETARIPVLVQTDRKLMKDSFAVIGSEHFLSKPCQPDELYAKINEILALPLPPLMTTETDPVAAALFTSPGRALPTETAEAKGFKNTAMIAVVVFVGVVIGVCVMLKYLMKSNKETRTVSHVVDDDAAIENFSDGEVSEMDDNGNIRAIRFYRDGNLKWKKTFNENGILTNQEVY